MEFFFLTHLTSQHNKFLYTGNFSHILHLDNIKIVQIECENEQNPYIWFLMGIDHSNPYIHSTTVLCDTCVCVCMCVCVCVCVCSLSLSV